jgi:succinoglycan biosynthesis transport protein ExoP
VNLLEFFRLLLRNWKVLFLFPLLTVVAVFFMTRNMKKEYESSTVVYTGLASGYSITSGEDERVDYFAVNNAFDNLMTTIKSRETLEEVGMRLLAGNLIIKKPAFNKISQETFDHLKDIIPQELKNRLVDPSSAEITYNNIEAFRRSGENNIITALLNSKTEIYSAEVINKNMTAARKQASDMIEITYKADDPAVCQQTLQFVVDVFIKRYKDMKSSETTNVVRYFEEQLQLASARLKKAEDKLRDFSSQNKIINYYEQAKFIAESKQDVIQDKQKQEESLMASRAALSRIETKISLRKNLMEVNENITGYREQLANVNYKIANAELYNEDIDRMQKYKKQASDLKKQISNEIESQYKLNNSTEGVSRESLLNEWLTNYLAVDENQSKLHVITDRLDGFDKIFNDMAPVGSKLKQIEREVDVAEKEYLSVLHGLNLAKLRQKNLEMSTNLTITDLPYFPLQPQNSKRFLLLVMSLLATFIISLSVILAKTLLGKAIKSPARAEKFTGLRFMGALPDDHSIHKEIDKEALDEIVLSHLTSNLQLETVKTGDDAKLVTVFSNKTGEGKSHFLRKLTSRLQKKTGDILWLQPGEENELSTAGGVTTATYRDNGSFHKAEDFKSWFKDQKGLQHKYEYIFLELSELSRYDLASNIVKDSDLSLMVLNSDRAWSDADARALRHFTRATEKEPLVLLNKMDLDRLETIVGELPKKRSRLRRLMKGMLTREFRKNYKF